MFFEIFYGFSQRRKVILQNIPHEIAVNFKISMCDMVSHTDDIFPFDFRTDR